MNRNELHPSSLCDQVGRTPSYLGLNSFNSGSAELMHQWRKGVRTTIFAKILRANYGHRDFSGTRALQTDDYMAYHVGGVADAPGKEIMKGNGYFDLEEFVRAEMLGIKE